MEKENEPSSREASLNMARSLFQEGADVESVMAKTGLSKPACLGLKGSLVKASKRLNARSTPTEAISKPETEVQANSEPLEEETPLRLSSPGVTFDYQTLMAIEEGMTKQQKANFRSAIALAQQRMMLNQNNNGHQGGSLQYNNNDPEAEFWKEMAKTEKVERALRLRDRYGGREGKLPDDIKQIVDAIRIGVDLVPKGSGVDPLSVYRAGRQDEQKTFENAIRQGESNEVDLKIEEIKQNERLDNRKMDFEVLKYQDQKQSGEKTLETVKEVAKTLTSGVLGDAIKGIGQGAAERIRGGPRVPMVKVQCPNCGMGFQANPKLEQVQCPSCGAMLAKQPQPEPTPSEPTQQQPQVETAPKEEVPLSVPTQKGESNF